MNHGKRPEFLSFKCAEIKGREEKCAHCPVNMAGYCEEFCVFILKQQEYILKLQKPAMYQDNAEQTVKENIHQEIDDWMPAFLSALVEVENKLPDYRLHSSFSGWVNNIINRRMLDTRRNYSTRSQPLEYILDQLDDCEILTGDKSALKRKIQRAIIPQDNNITGAGNVLFIINSLSLLKKFVFGNRKSLTMLLAESPVPDFDIIDQVKSADGVLIHYKGDKEAENLKGAVERMIRIYPSTVSLFMTNEDGKEEERAIPDTAYTEKQEQEEFRRAVNTCLEKLLVSKKYGKCAAFLLTFMDISREIALRRDESEDACLKNGTVKDKAVFEHMARLQNRTVDSVKQQHRRCRKNIEAPFRECINGRENGARP